ncbi:hypothetical protein GQX74_003209 [Glossina fuscipes]|nr:hypothetical protein GQX74_003209 [Glossina fuscipes]
MNAWNTKIMREACILTKPPALALKGSFKVISSSGASFLPKARPTTLTPCGRSRNFWLWLHSTLATIEAHITANISFCPIAFN